MKITDMRIRTVRIPMPEPNGSHTTTIVELFTDEGITGIGLTGGLGVPEIIRSLGHMVIGEDPFNYERIWERLYAQRKQAKGEIIRAISGIDIALWDIIGKVVKKPVYKLLGGFRDRVLCYASGGHYTAEGSQELTNLEKEMALYLDMGFKLVKMRVGRNPKWDLERVKTVRKTIGDDIELMIDLNKRWNVSRTIKFMRQCEEYNIYWIEEPVPPDDIQGLKEISDAIDTPVASGEGEFTLFGFRDLIEKRAVDIIQADVSVCGGITEWRKIAAMARAYHMEMAPHITEEVHAHLVASVPNGLILEIFRPLRDLRLRRQTAYLKEPIWPKDGYVEMSDKPGLGIELNEEGIEQHLVS